MMSAQCRMFTLYAQLFNTADLQEIYPPLWTKNMSFHDVLKMVFLFNSSLSIFLGFLGTLLNACYHKILYLIKLASNRTVTK